MSRILNQSVQRNLFEKKIDELIQTVEDFIKSYPLFSIAQKALTMVKKIIPYCNGKLLHYVMLKCEELQMMICDYHPITAATLPHIKLDIELHKQITVSLLSGSHACHIELYNYFMSGRYNEDVELLETNYLIKLREVAPNYVHQASQQ